MRSILGGVVLFFGAMILQWWWNAHLAYWGAAPQFLLALTVLLAARRGPLLAMLAGFGWGLCLDFSRADLFGASALTLTLAAYATGLARRQVDLSAGPSLAAAAFLATWAVFLVEGVLGLVFSARLDWPGWAPILAAPVLNAAVAAAGSSILDAWERGPR